MTLNSFRLIFRWKYSNWIIAILFGASLAMVGIGIAIEEAKLLFTIAYIFLSGTFLWSLGCWFVSESLDGENPMTWIRARRRRATRWDTHRFYILKYGISLAILLIFILSVYFVHWIDKKHELSLYRGLLYPASDPFPSTSTCNNALSANGLFVFFSPNFVGGGDRFPHTILRVKGKDILSLDRRPDGGVGISLDVFGQDGKIIAKIEKGRHVVNQNNILEMVRSDKSSLSVLDQTGTQVLSIRYFNPQAIWVDAVLYYPGYPYRIVLNGSGLEATNCSYNSGGADMVIE